MKKRSLSIGMLWLIGLLMCVVLYWNGNYIVYMLAYIFAFIFLLCHAVFSAYDIWGKIAQVIVFAIIMAVQILFAVFVIRPFTSGGLVFDLCRLSGTVFLFIPLLVRQIFF